MEPRKITVVDQGSSRTVVLNTAATTLGELKRDLEREGLDFSNKTFYEGISKTTLREDASLLPHDIPYKGNITNELIFGLSYTNKKITSGVLSRTEAYQMIKEGGLQAAFKNKTGKSHTNASTQELLDFLKSVKEDSEAPKCSSTEEMNVIKETILKLADVLYSRGFLSMSEMENIMEAFKPGFHASEENKENSASPYSAEEIRELLNM